MDRDDTQVREIIFDETQLENLQLIGSQLFERGDSPEDAGYQRVLKRPVINWLQVACQILIPVALAAVLFLILDGTVPAVSQVLIPAGLLVLWLIVRMKQCVICLVRMYQYFAPAEIRNKCRFEPSCSEYMIQAIEKYGFVKGVCKGINRLGRCNIDHGGYDAP